MFEEVGVNSCSFIFVKVDKMGELGIWIHLW